MSCMFVGMAKSSKYSASTWRRLDAAYRKQQKERRVANAVRCQTLADTTSLPEAVVIIDDFSETSQS